jgi:Bifunctional DNA primase/polymerase, N-terminal
MSLTAAIDLAARGFAVFPVVGKRPITPHGVYSASTDPRVFCGFDWGRGVDCGVATGAASGIDVLDVDVREEGPRLREEQENSSLPGDQVRVSGFATLAALGPLPETLAASTPNAGRHYYFRHIAESRSRKLGAGVEWFSDKKLVVVPPAQGREWLNDAPIAEAPEWLKALVLALPDPSHGREGRNSSALLVAGAGAAAAAEVPKPIYLEVLRLMRGASAREQRWARALYNVVADKRSGRNAALYYAAKRFCDVPISREGAAKLLMLASRANGYLAKDGEEAVRATIMSGLGLKDWPAMEVK